MANSRSKILIPMLVLCFFAVTAYGQAVLSLGSNPTRVRTEGITEVVGLITMTNATNQPQIIAQNTVINVTFDGNITNRPRIATSLIGAVGHPDGNVYTTGPATSQQDGTVGGGGLAQYTTGCTTTAAPFCVGLIIASSGTTMTLTIPSSFVNTSFGDATKAPCNAAPATANSLCIAPGGSVNIQGVRVNVSGVSLASPTNGFVYATLVTTPANALTFPGGSNATVVGRAQPTIQSVNVVNRLAQGQCNFPRTPTSNLPGTLSTSQKAAAGIGALGSTLNLTITESSNFGTAFNAANSLGVNGPSNSPTLNPVAQPWDESGVNFTPGGVNTATTVGMTAAMLGFQGIAPAVTRGVNLVINLAGLPNGTVFIVPQQVTSGGAVSSSTGLAIGTGITLGLVLPFGPPGTVATDYSGFAPTAGAATIAYEVTSTTTGSSVSQDAVSIPMWITAPAGTVAPLGAAGTANVSVGPTGGSSGFSGTAANNFTLRFATNTGVPATPLSIGNITACLTNLLFPFVSNIAGATFNTGLAIANTALDSSFGAANPTTGETGGVTLYFFGVAGPTGGTAGIPMPIKDIAGGGTAATSGVLAPGEHTVLLLNDGSTSAIAKGFQGYIVALCNFRYAHGLGLILDNFGVGPANVGFSYLPLVIDGTAPCRSGANNLNPGVNTVGPGCTPVGEALGH